MRCAANKPSQHAVISWSVAYMRKIEPHAHPRVDLRRASPPRRGVWTSPAARAGGVGEDVAPNCRGAASDRKPSASRRDADRHPGRTNLDRTARVVPIRYGRMSQSVPFWRSDFDACDRPLRRPPDPRAVLWGLSSPEFWSVARAHLVYDINDFDETLPAPWRMSSAGRQLRRGGPGISFRQGSACGRHPVRRSRPILAISRDAQ